MKTTQVSVVIPVLQDERVATAVDSVLACDDSVASVEVIVVDNGSTAEFTDWLRGVVSARARCLSVPAPGVYAARNAGVDAAVGEFVFFTDADCVVHAGWIAAGVEMFSKGADLVQGFSGSTGNSRLQRLIQKRYEARLRRLGPGEPTECDTRNLAVRRTVFDKLRFDARYRRVGDTQFGLQAEQAGFRVAYAPEMRVDHEHQEDLRLFAAKQVCHGWGAQRLTQENPSVEWHGGHLKLVAAVSHWMAPRRGTGVLAQMCAKGAIFYAGLLERAVGWLPEKLAIWWLTGVDKLAALGGHLAYRPGAPEPSPSQLLRRTLPRD